MAGFPFWSRLFLAEKRTLSVATVSSPDAAGWDRAGVQEEFASLLANVWIHDHSPKVFALSALNVVDAYSDAVIFIGFEYFYMDTRLKY